MSEISFAYAHTFIISSCVVGFIFGIYNWFAVLFFFKNQVMSIDTNPTDLKEPLNPNNNECIKVMNDVALKIQNV